MMCGVLWTVYMGSMGGTLYAAMYMHSYIMSLLFCGIQVSLCLVLPFCMLQISDSSLEAHTTQLLT